jgi:hypothetical protein
MLPPDLAGQIANKEKIVHHELIQNLCKTLQYCSINYIYSCLRQLQPIGGSAMFCPAPSSNCQQLQN